MISLKIRLCVDEVVSAYKEVNVRYFFTSAVIDDVRKSGINYAGMEADVVILLQSMVDQGILRRRYVSTDSNNPTKKIFDSFEDIPEDGDLYLDDNNAYIVPMNDLWTETFFEFAKSNQNYADDHQQTDPAALSILEKGLLKSNDGVQKYLGSNLKFSERR